MTHDPFCTDWVYGDFPGRQTCVCKLIRRVRKDERDKAVAAVETMWTDDPMWDGTNWNNALFSAIEAIRGET